MQGNADLAEAPGSFVYNFNYNEDPFPTFANPTFNVDREIVASKDSWALDMIGLAFHYKDLEHESDLQLKSRWSSNTFAIQSLVAYDGKSQRLLSSSVRRSRRSLRFLFYSVDATHEYEIAPVASFDPTLSERLTM